jgi:hypothetical protein
MRQRPREPEAGFLGPTGDDQLIGLAGVRVPLPVGVPHEGDGCQVVEAPQSRDLDSR